MYNIFCLNGAGVILGRFEAENNELAKQIAQQLKEQYPEYIFIIIKEERISITISGD